MKMTRLATLRAKPISWVTTIMVMPTRARSTMTSRTSLTISGSSAEVGSSNSITMGSIARARDRVALLLATGQLRRKLLRLLLEADPLQQGHALGLRLVVRPPEHLFLG